MSHVSSKAGSPVALLARELSPLPYTPTSPIVSTPTPTVKATPSILGRKRPASKAVSVTAALPAFLMRFQLSTTPVAKRTASLPPHLTRTICLYCSKRIDKASSIKRKVASKSKVVPVGASCIKLANKKCEYYAA